MVQQIIVWTLHHTHTHNLDTEAGYVPHEAKGDSQLICTHLKLGYWLLWYLQLIDC
jgi:hypothetical protein